MRRRGQIFLIMTILVITFMIGITAILLDVRRADYLDPAPDSDKTLDAWRTTVDSLIQIIDIELANHSQNGDPDLTEVNFTIPVLHLEQYLNERGLSAEIDILTNRPLYRIDSVGNTSVEIRSSFGIFIQSPTTTIDQEIELSVNYTAAYSPANSEVYVRKQINLENWEYIVGCTFSDPNIVDNSNGSYDTSLVSTPATVQIFTPSTVELTIDVT